MNDKHQITEEPCEGKLSSTVLESNGSRERVIDFNCSITILKFAKFFGSLGQTSHTLWGQLWFVAETGELPQGVVMVTYIKNRSLNDFNRLVASVQSRGVEPATGIFIPEFVKHSGQVRFVS